jgi:phage terminase large subunit
MSAVAVEREVAFYDPRGGCADFYSARDPEVLAVGPAGTGKTLAACWKLHHIAYYVPGVRLLMARKVLEDLKTGALATYTNHVKPQLDGVITFGGNRFYPGEFRYRNGSVIHVVGMDKPGKVMSAEYDVIFVNEAAEIDEETWQTLKSRLRNGRLAYQQLIGDCNPSNPKHWLKKRCDAGDTRYIETTHKDNPAYWSAELNDWTTMGRVYVNETLAGLTGVTRKRLFEGVWAATEGAVYPNFDSVGSVRKVDTDGWRTIAGIDVGATNPTVVLTIRVRGDGRIHIERELYERNMNSEQITSAVADVLKRIKAEVAYADPSAKAFIETWQLQKLKVRKANNDVKFGIGIVNSAVDAGMTVDPSCVNTITELESYRWMDGEKDQPLKIDDHAMDALRYGLVGETAPKIEVAIL